MTVSDVAQIVTALATLALAISTYVLALKTRDVANQASAEAAAVRDQVDVSRKQVDVANEQASIARLALQASVRLWLTAHEEERPLIHQDDPQIGWDIAQPDVIQAEVPLRNVGMGLCLIVPDSPLIFSEGLSGKKGEIRRSGRPSSAVIAPGDSTTLHFQISVKGESGLSLSSFTGQQDHSGAFWVRVSYTDVTMGQESTAEIRIVRPIEAAIWKVLRIAYFSGTESVPFAIADF
jgi:hypothetical protein